MNKLTKATIAAAAGVALLLGTGGTLAYWNASVDLGAKTQISSGNLDISTARTATTTKWQLKRGTAAAVDVNIATVKIVPGDKLIYKTEFDVTAQGQNLKFTVGLTPGSIAPVAANAADQALATYLDANKSGTVAINGGAAAPIGAPVEVSAAADNSVTTVPVVITYELTFPYSDTAAGAENAAKLGNATLDKFQVAVRQVANGAV